MSLVLDPQVRKDPGRLDAIADGSHPLKFGVLWGEDRPLDLLDLCCGSGAIGVEAARLGARVTAVDAHPVPVLAVRAAHGFPAQLDYRLMRPTGEVVEIGKALKEWGELVSRRAFSWRDELAGVDAVIMAKEITCDSCAETFLAQPRRPRVARGPEVRFVDVPMAAVERAAVQCPHCSAGQRIDRAQPERFASAAIVGGDEGHLDLPAAWSRASEDVRSSRQRRILKRLSSAVAGLERELESLGMPAEQSRALFLLLALGVSKLSGYLEVSTDWTYGSAQRFGGRHIPIRRPNQYAEVSLDYLRRRWQQHLHDVADGLSSRLASPVIAKAGDMTRLDLPDNSFDVVAWDPPFYDNIDYSGAASSWSSVLSELLPLEQDAWGVLDDVALSTREESTQLDQLSRAASEAARVLRAGGKLAVFWIVREPEELVSFLQAVQPAGFELVDTIRLRSEIGGAREHRGPVSYLLVLRHIARMTETLSADPARVLEMADQGYVVLHAGVAELLNRYWDDADLDRHIPTSYRGTRIDRIGEYVMAHAAPEELLEELGHRQLREVLTERGLDESLGRESSSYLAREILATYGFAIPRIPSFTLTHARNECGSLSRRIVVPGADDPHAIGHAFGLLVERMIKFLVASWGQHAAGEDWLGLIRDRCGEDLHSGARPLMGQWMQTVAKLPKALQGESEYFARIHVAVRRSGLVGALERATQLRNAVAHEGRVSSAEIVEQLPAVAEAVTDALGEMESRRALPVVVIPMQEVRDRYGRRRLRAEDESGRPVDMFLSEQLDLAHPLVWLPGEKNPADVDPVLLAYDNVMSVLGAQ